MDVPVRACDLSTHARHRAGMRVLVRAPVSVHVCVRVCLYVCVCVGQWEARLNRLLDTREGEGDRAGQQRVERAVWTFSHGALRRMRCCCCWPDLIENPIV